MECIKRAQDIAESSIEEALDKLADSIRNLPKNRQKQLKQELEMPDDKKIYTIEELAKILQLSSETVRRAVRDGNIKVIRLGTGPKAPIRITKAEVDKILSEGM
jgi:excisionase family DNA binding protein